MNKSYIPSLITFLIGMIITIVGALFKIMHWPGASVSLIIGMSTEVVAIMVLVFTLIKNSKKINESIS